MNQTIQMGQVVQPSAAAQVTAAVENLKEWWHRKSETFTLLCGTEGDVFTHGEVVLAHLGLAAFFVVLGVAQWVEGGAL